MAACAVCGVLAFGAPAPAHAQAIVASINGYPITTYDIDQRMKLLRALRKPATRDAAAARDESAAARRIAIPEIVGCFTRDVQQTCVFALTFDAIMAPQ